LLEALAKLDSQADVLLVGHMPYMASLAGQLLGMQVGGFATGAALRVELASPLEFATLIWRS
jgi:phosphohistidine phosphatase